jgi:ectoine hydroxylase-related dioxygenase (phytanoyl-CoA dioxygenase family)
VDEVRTKGFTIVPGAVDAAAAAVLRDKLHALAEEQRRTATPERAVDDYMVHNLMLLDPAFLHLLENPVLVAAMDELLGDTSIVYAYTSSSMPAHGTNYSNRVHCDSPRVIPGYMTNLGIIVVLDDFTDDNGATWFLPGSFERLDAPTEDEFFAGAERVYPRRGDMVVFNARIWHVGGENTTDTARHAVTMNGCRAYMRSRFDYPRMYGYDRADELSPVLRRLLGYNVRTPTSLDEYYVPADQRLYLANQG